MSAKELDESRKIHLQINGNPIVPKDRLLCNRWIDYNTLTTTDKTKVTCKSCLKKMKKADPLCQINIDHLQEIANEWAVDYKPMDTNLPIQWYASYGFIQGYLAALQNINKK